eukprot:CAMPEP_0168369140 /NCGR_PEP_ID=MMETSP0228-20121227/6607_1 /TAXON_ID=133427 /ORGANISM="Protoceratium reticulatum, Strain CCCM 535 (=CCMP 1889)" /LENGTH=98 /DNA_ID=CAMNT_0008381997 /DNA_START=615 /DNA_END=908 /DNA_ORIENTATION=-
MGTRRVNKFIICGPPRNKIRNARLHAGSVLSASMQAENLALLDGVHEVAAEGVGEDEGEAEAGEGVGEGLGVGVGVGVGVSVGAGVGEDEGEAEAGEG